MDCDVLIEKLTSRVRSWDSRHLSYVGGVMLVNSVLLHIHSYRASIFILPKLGLKGITAICRNFLWDGKVATNRSPLMAWDLVCRPKREGGLGITEYIRWNKAAIAKYVWNIAQKADNLWVKWINNVCLKDNDWWQYSQSQDCCWYWKKVCTTRDTFAPSFVENGWLKSKGNIQLIVGTNGEWVNKRIHPDWDEYGVEEIWKHNFICWLVLHRRLLTKDRLHRQGISQNNRCIMCGANMETVKHLFFECAFSMNCLQGILKWTGRGV